MLHDEFASRPTRPTELQRILPIGEGLGLGLLASFDLPLASAVVGLSDALIQFAGSAGVYVERASEVMTRLFAFRDEPPVDPQAQRPIVALRGPRFLESPDRAGRPSIALRR